MRILLGFALGVTAIVGWQPCRAQVTAIRPPVYANQRPVVSLEAKTAEECAQIATPRADRPGDSTWYPAALKQLFIPPMTAVPSSVRGQTIRVRFQIDRFGQSTGAEFAGKIDSGFAKKLRDVMLRYRYSPAVATGCPIASTFDISLTMGGLGRPSTIVPPAIALSSTWPVLLQSPWTIGSTAMLPPPSKPPPNCEPKRPRFSYGEWPDASGPGGNGRVELRFVIDSSGTPIDSTVRVLESTAPKYLDAVKKLFPTLHFTPAWCDGGPVAMDVQQLFTFYKN